ncbi:MAG: hypothetical protein WDW38_004684 [Sanguina aurantia]
MTSMNRTPSNSAWRQNQEVSELLSGLVIPFFHATTRALLAGAPPAIGAYAHAAAVETAVTALMGKLGEATNWLEINSRLPASQCAPRLCKQRQQ